MPTTEPLGPMVRMRAIRNAHGLTLVQVADKMAEHGFDITEGGLSNIELGRKKGSDRMLIAWAKALGVDPLDVWHGPLRPELQSAARFRQTA